MLAAPASAATMKAEYDHGRLKYHADAGENNTLVVAPGLETIDFTDAGALATNVALTGAGACNVSGLTFTCTSMGISRIDADLGDGVDTLSATSVASPMHVEGTAGSKTIATGSGDDEVAVQNGAADVVACGPGDDSVLADAQDVVGPDCEHVSLAVPPATDGGAVSPPGDTDLIPPPAIGLPIGSLALPNPGLALVPLRCAATAVQGCAGDVEIFVWVPRHRHRHGHRRGRVMAARGHYVTQQRRRIGRRRFKLAAGTSKAVPVRLALRGHFSQVTRRRHRVRALLRVTQRDAVGKPISVETRRVVLKLSRKWSSRRRGRR
jgi:hypothetical protein